MKDIKKCSNRRWLPYLLIAPEIIIIAIFTLYPIVHLIFTSFYKVNQLNPDKTRFVALKNYSGIFKKVQFQKALVNTFEYALICVVFITIIALLMAVLLGMRRTRYNQLVQTIIFTPHIVATVSIAIIWVWIYDVNFGLANALLNALGLPSQKWISSSDSSLMSVAIVAIWKSFGYYSLIFISAIAGISKEIFDACEVDGARGFKKFYKITLPLISPQLFFALIILTIDSFKVFELTQIMTDGGPNNSSNTLVLWIYRLVFFEGNVGQGAAAGVVLFVIVGIMTALYFSMLSRKVHYQ